MRHVGPTFDIYIYITNHKQIFNRKFLFFFIFSFLLSLLSSIYENRIVRIRRGKKQNAILNEGYAWEPKTRDFAEFLIKIRKILCFGFSQIYGFLPVRIAQSRRSN